MEVPTLSDHGYHSTTTASPTGHHTRIPGGMLIFNAMNYLLEVPKEKQAFLEELLHAFPFIKTRKLSAEKAERMKDLVEAIDEIKEIEAGKRKPRSMRSLLRGL